MFTIKPFLTKKEDATNQVYYHLSWSALTVADKYRITTHVPSVAGLYELYYMDTKKRLNMLAITDTWYGGLRSQIRKTIDPDTMHDPAHKYLVTNAPIYYRYTCSNSFGDLLDAVWFLHSIYFPDDIRVEHSHRYKKIFLKETAPDRVYWLD